MHEWMDHSPIIQCWKYQKFGHYAANCKSTTKCHICHSDHEESQHIQACTKCTNKTNMVIDSNNSCMHTNSSCINCKTEGIDDYAHSSNQTRCPIRLRKLSEAHEQPRHIVKGRMAKRPTTHPTRELVCDPRDNNSIHRHRNLRSKDTRY